MANFNGNIDLSAVRKKRFTIDNDENRVLELNTSDLSIIQRLNDSYPKLEELEKEAAGLTDGIDDDDGTVLGTRLTSIDKHMRDCIDFIFDSNVSELCAPSGSMYDPIGGSFRYEVIVEVLMNLYEKELSAEMKKVQKRMQSHTEKYNK